MNIDLSVRREIVDQIRGAAATSSQLDELRQCVQQFRGMIVSKGLKSAPTEFQIQGVPDELAAVAVQKLMQCSGVAGAYVKPAVELPGPPMMSSGSP